MELSHTEKEMFETIDVVRKFDLRKIEGFAKKLEIGQKQIILTGMGSSVLFPAKNAKDAAFRIGLKNKVEAAFASDFTKFDASCFDNSVVFLCSNSGKTKEVMLLLEKLDGNKKANLVGITATPDSILHQKARETHVLSCGKEQGVAATKSVIEQALTYEFLLRILNGENISKYGNGLLELSKTMEKILSAKIDEKIIEKLASSKTIYFVGSENGVAQEVALKIIEATGKMTGFYPNTEIIHGPQEFISEEDAVVIVNPSELSGFMDDFAKAGCPVFCISGNKEKYETITIPLAKGFENYCYLVAGWNLLKHIGHKLGVDMDHPKKVTKVGNEYKATFFKKG